MNYFNRRQFLILATGFIAGCQAADEEGAGSAGRPPRLINAGPAANYARDGSHGKFRDAGFFLVRNGDNLVALSAYCTHRRCKLELEKDRTFYCPCHGSTFNAQGHVTMGPAKRDLPELASSINERGELVVSVPGR